MEVVIIRKSETSPLNQLGRNREWGVIPSVKNTCRSEENRNLSRYYVLLFFTSLISCIFFICLLSSVDTEGHCFVSNNVAKDKDEMEPCVSSEIGLSVAIN